MSSGLARRIGRASAEFVRRSGRIAALPGLSEAELARAEQWLGAAFAPDHRAFLREVLPHGHGWPDWRYIDARVTYDWCADAPVQGLLFDVQHSGFWHPSWGARPEAARAALDLARTRLADVPRLIPVHGHRYLPAAPVPPGHPVLSLHQTDLILYGTDLEDYLHREFASDWSGEPVAAAEITVPFWDRLGQGVPGARTDHP
jgi:hypothetical protein